MTVAAARELRQMRLGLGVTLALAIAYAIVMAGLNIAVRNSSSRNG